jgi:hypothetical protein
LPWCSGHHDGRKIILPLAILGSDNIADLTFISATGLLDTGASCSAIGPRNISELGLIPYEKRNLIVATEDRLVDYFLFRVGLFDSSGDDGGSRAQLPYVFPDIDGFGMRPSSYFDVILGMDVLRHCELHIDRIGHWRLSFG